MPILAQVLLGLVPLVPASSGEAPTRKEFTRSARPADESGDVIVTYERQFIIPIQMEPARRKEIKRLYLYVSRDRGKTWKKVIGVSPDEKTILFSGSEDGLHWFALQVVGTNGMIYPEKMQAALKVLINTATPVRGR